jgi:hypothetical protein
MGGDRPECRPWVCFVKYNELSCFYAKGRRLGLTQVMTIIPSYKDKHSLALLDVLKETP